MTTYYSTGTASVSNGGTTVTGSGTAWASVVQAGDLFLVPAQGLVAMITAVASNTSITIDAWPGTTISGAAYKIVFASDAIRQSERARQLLEQLSAIDANGRGLFYGFSTTTTDADPGAGVLRLNNATIASATAAYLDNLDANGATVSTILDTWDDTGSSAGRGQLWVRQIADPSIFHAWNVTGSVVDGTGYRKLTLSYIGGSGAFADADEIMVQFVPVGNGEAGTDGADGVGVPAGGTTGQVLKKASGTDYDTEWAADAGGIGGSTGSTDNRLIRADGTGGATVQDSAITVDDSGNISGVGTLSTSGDIALQKASGQSTLTVESPTGPRAVFFNTTESPAANAVVFQFLAKGRNNNLESVDYGSLLFRIDDNTDGSEDAYAVFRVCRGGTTANDVATFRDGLTMTGATGGDKGSGTINAKGVYDDNVLLTDYVFDKWLGVQQSYSDSIQVKYDALNADMFSVSAHVDFMRSNRRLYGMPDLNDCIDGMVKEKSLGEMVQMLWQSLELAHIHIAELHERLERMNRGGGPA